MPELSPQTCATLIALLQALSTPAAYDDAVAMARTVSRDAVTLVNAYDNHCASCIDALREKCDASDRASD